MFYFNITILLIFCIVTIIYAHVNDRTIERYQIGEDIVDAVIDKLDSSCLFIKDKFMLKRLAYVQSNYGKNMKNNNIGGIWRITEEQFNITKQKLKIDLVALIYRSFHVDWSFAKYDDLNRAFYSGLAAILYLQVLNENRKFEEIPFSIEEQATIFQRLIVNNGTIQNFIEYKTKSAEVKTDCKSTRPIDLFVLLDESSSLTERNFKRVKQFLANFIKNFEFGNGNTKSRISIATFSNDAHMYYNFTDMQDNNLIDQKILNMSYRQGRTNTAAGLELMIEQVDKFRRSVDSGVPLVALVLTDGASNKKQKTIAMAKKVHKKHMLVYALGIGNFKNLDIEELNAISSSPTCQYTYLLRSFEDLIYFSQLLKKKLTEVPKVLSGTEGSINLKFNLPTNENFYFQIILSKFGTDLELKGSEFCSNPVTLYLSKTVTKPNNIIYDKKYVIECNKVLQIKLYPLRNQISFYGSLTAKSSNKVRIKRAFDTSELEEPIIDEDNIDALKIVDFSKSTSTIYDTTEALKIDEYEEPITNNNNKNYKKTDSNYDYEEPLAESKCSKPQQGLIPVILTIKGGGSCDFGKFGDHCNKKCNCRGDVSCLNTGECPGCICKDGFYGPGCQTKCSFNTFGFMCSKKCHCKNNEKCNETTGLCPKECADGWSGDDCQTFICHGKIGFLHSDEDFCDKFWYCSSNKRGSVGEHITCPQGFHWAPGTKTCTFPSNLAIPCTKGTSRLNEINQDVTGNLTRAQLEVRRSYSNVASTKKNDEEFDDEGFSMVATFVENRTAYSTCLDNIASIWNENEDYACPKSLNNLRRTDFEIRHRLIQVNHMKRICGSNTLNCIDNINFTIYRHDPNSCMSFHKCEYSSKDGTLIQSTLGTCDNTIFNQDWAFCVNSYQFGYLRMHSTMPDKYMRESCNELMLTTLT